MEMHDRKEALKFLEFGDVLIEKAGQVFRDMLKFLEWEHVLIEKVGQLVATFSGHAPAGGVMIRSWSGLEAAKGMQ